jgi:hypothetical protein
MAKQGDLMGARPLANARVTADALDALGRKLDVRWVSSDGPIRVCADGGEQAGEPPFAAEELRSGRDPFFALRPALGRGADRGGSRA